VHKLKKNKNDEKNIVIDVVPRESIGPTKAGLAKAIETGTIYNSTSPYHNDLHEFTYLVAMRDFCNKTL
jgi:hypothetical protein